MRLRMLLSDPCCFVAQVHAQTCGVRRFRLESQPIFSFLFERDLLCLCDVAQDAKMALLADEPLALKGGIACVLKKKKHILTAHKFRSIMLRNYVIKHHLAFLRTRLYALVHCSFHAAQSGGIKGRGADLANATLRWNQPGPTCYWSI